MKWGLIMDAEQKTPNNDNAQVKIPPPLCFGAFLGVGLFLQSDWINGEFGQIERLILGVILFAASIAVIAKEALSHGKSGSNVEPWKPTTLIISSGLYGYSRNPIYVGMITAYAGIALVAGSFGALILLPFCILIIRYHVIAREEAYLEQKFGEEYLNYKQKVRRWI